MIRYLLFLGIAYLLYLVVKRSIGLQKPLERSSESEQFIDDEMVKDPVCGTYIPRSIAIARKRGGVVHYFCSEKCAAAFPLREEV